MEKLTVALVGYRRPRYLRRVLDGLRACQGFDTAVERIVASIDDGHKIGSDCFDVVCKFDEETSVRVDAVRQPKRTGIVGNSVLALKMAFDGGARNVLYLEDDGLLKPDALRLAQWFCGMNDRAMNLYLAFGLSAHGDRDDERNDPEKVKEYNRLPCPFAYVLQKPWWPFVLRNWCRKNYHSCGWSWSMTFAARMQGCARFLAPRLSRVENIGREDGTNGGPDVFDRTQTGIPFSDGSYTGPYEIVNNLSQEELEEIEEWMLSEINREEARRFDGWIYYGVPPEIEADPLYQLGQTW